jgi:hypothetical protein
MIEYRKRKSTTRIILHDSHTVPDDRLASDVDRWDAYREGLKMGLTGVGYHCIHNRDGSRHIGRHHSVIGSHTPTQNLDSIGICLVGGREPDEFGYPIKDHGVDNFTPEQVKDSFDFILEMFEIYGPLNIVGHYEVQRYIRKGVPTCPCIDMDDYRQRFDIYRKTGELL